MPRGLKCLRYLGALLDVKLETSCAARGELWTDSALGLWLHCHLLHFDHLLKAAHSLKSRATWSLLFP